MPFRSEHTGKDAVESAHPKRRSLLGRHKQGNALAHLAGGLVGESQGQDAPRLHPLLQQVSHFVGEDTRLATARTGYHQRRRVDAKHRLTLARIQIF